jgi:hypothetical protein
MAVRLTAQDQQWAVVDWPTECLRLKNTPHPEPRLDNNPMICSATTLSPKVWNTPTVPAEYPTNLQSLRTRPQSHREALDPNLSLLFQGLVFDHYVL